MSEFTPCTHPDLPGQVAQIATGALEGWRGLGWEPIGDSLTPAEALVAEVEADGAVQELAAEVPDLTVKDVLTAVGDDPDKAAAALDAERSREKPRTTLVDRLTPKAGQPGDPEGN